MAALRVLLIVLAVAAVIGPLVIVGIEWRGIRRRGMRRCESCDLPPDRADACYCDRCGGRIVRQ